MTTETKKEATNKIKVVSHDATKPSCSEITNALYSLSQAELKQLAIAMFDNMNCDTLTATNKELMRVWRSQRSIEALTLVNAYHVGDRVRAKGGKRGENLGIGTIIKVNRTKVQVKFDSQPLGIWNVPFALLEKA